MSLEAKYSNLKKIFSSFSSQADLYQEIMAWGKRLPPYPESEKIEENLVSGCQSLLYLQARFENENLFFNAESDALISKGLAALLVYYYSGEAPEALLKHKPTFLEDFHIVQSLSPTRAGGVASLFIMMQKRALETLVSYRN